MCNDGANLNISAQQARRFALSFYNIVSKYCAENHEEYIRWEEAQNRIKEGETNDDKTT